MNNDLPLLNSERTEYQNKLRQIKEDLELACTATLHRVNGIINEAEYLTDEIKEMLLKEIWK